jgi:hypothetical protein
MLNAGKGEILLRTGHGHSTFSMYSNRSARKYYILTGTSGAKQDIFCLFHNAPSRAKKGLWRFLEPLFVLPAVPARKESGLITRFGAYKSG